jgi:hypothetical protein
MRLAVFGLALLAAAGAGSTDAQGRQVVASTEEARGPLLRTVLRVQDGSQPLDSFQVTRLRRAGSAAPLGVLVLLPPAGNNFGFYEWDEQADYQRSFAAFFARRGVEVWGYSPRESALAAGQCGVTLDCSAAAHWDLATQLGDIDFVRTLVRAARPQAKVAVAGFSLGAINSVATLDAHGSDYAGAIVWEGSPFSSDPAIQAYNAAFCAQLQGAVAAGVLLDEQTGVGLQALAFLSRTDPEGLSAFPGLPAGTTNRQAFVGALSVHQPAPVQPRPGYLLAVGDPRAGTFTYADPERLYASIDTGFNDVLALASVRDVSCGLAGDARFVDDLHAYEGHVLLVEAGQAFGPIMAELPGLLPRAHVQRLRFDALGHLDAYMNPYHRLTAEGPMYLWLVTRVFL